MPRRPKHPCAYPGCPRLCDGRYCEEHRKLTDIQYNRYERDGDWGKRYGKEWRKIRELYRSRHPLCEMCLKEGRYVPAELVHHILPLKEGGTNEEGNLMSLCSSCHGKIHAERGDRWHTRGRGGRNL